MLNAIGCVKLDALIAEHWSSSVSSMITSRFIGKLPNRLGNQSVE